ncbi:MAG TPA: 4Fe-4S binding protein [Firmicutes bacterium]|nr:4Fe-4S binding protein [Bacillota bacterium]
MEKRVLGRTGLVVSRLCFGTLTVGPLQSNLSPDAAAALFLDAIDQGINFFDTAELYRTYPHLHKMLKAVDRDEVVISSRSYAYTYQGMKESIERALEELGTDYLDIFMLHEQESGLTLKGHGDALRCLIDAREAGIVKAVGVSTHAIEVVRCATLMPEIDVIHPLLNVRGIGIKGGTRAEMEAAIREARAAGKGIYAMKCLGGGNLIRDYAEAVGYIAGLSFVDAVAVGMQSRDEIRINVRAFGSAPGNIRNDLLPGLMGHKTVHVEEGCTGCGSCVGACSYQALSLVDGRPRVDQSRCILCGYCAAACPGFHIRVY